MFVPCGTLWNLLAHRLEDQKTLRQLGAVNMLRSQVYSKHKMILTSSAAALKNPTAVSFRPVWLENNNAAIGSHHLGNFLYVHNINIQQDKPIGYTRK